MHTEIQALRDAMNKTFHEREPAIDAKLVALLAKEHIVLLGKPGTGTSALARAVAGALGAGYFEYLFTRFSTPEEFIGPLSMKALEKDEYRRKTAGYMPDALVTFLDEIFKANSASLNTLLPVLNERAIHNGGKLEHIPLVVCEGRSGTANSGPHATTTGIRSMMTTTVVHAPWTNRGERICRVRRITATPSDNTVMRAADSARMSIFIVLSSRFSVRASARVP